jgi:hypothetical protein
MSGDQLVVAGLGVVAILLLLAVVFFVGVELGVRGEHQLQRTRPHRTPPRPKAASR